MDEAASSEIMTLVVVAALMLFYYCSSRYYHCDDQAGRRKWPQVVGARRLVATVHLPASLASRWLPRALMLRNSRH